MKKKPYEQKMYKEKKKKNKIRMRFDFNRKGVIFFVVAAFIVCAVSIIGTDMGWIDQGGVVSSLKRNSADAPVTYGKVLSQDETEENGKQVCALKVKIQAKRTKDQTVEQNYYNIIQFVKNNPDKYDEIHYEGVAENSGGEEVKAVTFDVSKELIQSIRGGTVEAKDIPEKAENLYILYTLTDEAETTADSKTAETTSESESTSESAHSSDKIIENICIIFSSVSFSFRILLFVLDICFSIMPQDRFNYNNCFEKNTFFLIFSQPLSAHPDKLLQLLTEKKWLQTAFQPLQPQSHFNCFTQTITCFLLKYRDRGEVFRSPFLLPV